MKIPARLRDGIIGSFAVLATLFLGLQVMQILESLSLRALSAYVLAVEEAPNHVAAVGALLVFLALPVALFWMLYLLIKRTVADEDALSLVRLLIFLSLSGSVLGRETVEAALPATAGELYASWSGTLMNAILVGFVAWLLYRAIRWLVADERDARSSGNTAPS